jgi:hypothetical protein
MLHDVIAFFCPVPSQVTVCIYYNSLATIQAANYVYNIEYLAKRLQIFNSFIGSTLLTDKKNCLAFIGSK